MLVFYPCKQDFTNVSYSISIRLTSNSSYAAYEASPALMDNLSSCSSINASDSSYKTVAYSRSIKIADE